MLDPESYFSLQTVVSELEQTGRPLVRLEAMPGKLRMIEDS
jgi:hypothetical protein